MGIKNVVKKFIRPTVVYNTIVQNPVHGNLFERKEECCGCTACFAVCPPKAITMQADEEGFEYPVIDSNKCVQCKMCIRICPVKCKIPMKITPKKDA
jgi:ferredoxin